MNRWILRVSRTLALPALFVCGFAQAAQPPSPRIVTVGSRITEICVALGCEKNLVGTDSSSQFPPQVQKLPQVGYARQLSAEGILSLRPSLVILPEEAGPPQVVAQIKASGVALKTVPLAHSMESALDAIGLVGDALGEAKKAEELKNSVKKEYEKFKTTFDSKAGTKKKKILFVYARSGQGLMVSGSDTAADAMIQLAGAENSVTTWKGYKPLSREFLLMSPPDVILFTKGGLQDAGGKSAVENDPQFSPAFQGKTTPILAIDDLLLLGFGPRLVQGLWALREGLTP